MQRYSKYDPCALCGDRTHCHAMCRSKKDFLDYVEGEVNTYKVRVVKRVVSRVFSINKNGILREEIRYAN